MYGATAGLIVMAAGWSDIGKSQYDQRLGIFTGAQSSAYLFLIAGAATVAYFAWLSLAQTETSRSEAIP